MTPTPEQERQLAEAFDQWWTTQDKKTCMRATAFRAGALSQLARVEALEADRRDLYRVCEGLRRITPHDNIDRLAALREAEPILWRVETTLDAAMAAKEGTK